MRFYFVCNHSQGLTIEEWKQVSSDVQSTDKLRSLNSWQRTDVIKKGGFKKVRRPIVPIPTDLPVSENRPGRGVGVPLPSQALREDQLKDVFVPQLAIRTSSLPSRMRVQLAVRLEVDPVDDTIYNRSLFGIDVDDETITNVPGAAGSFSARLRAWLQQAIRDAIPAGQKSRFTLELVEDGSDPDPDKQTVYEWLATNWYYPPEE